MESPLDVGSGPVKVRDALLGLTALNHDVVLLDYGNVVIQRDYRNLSKVRLLSGGVAGTDLIHAVCVGKGMLTAAILGEETVPSSRQILHTIKELNEGDNCGICVIVQANADLFNFGLAVERANTDCRTRVKLLPINDDKSAKKERYSCGFILLAKILGALAESGALYNDVCECYKQIIDQIITVPLNYTHDGSGTRKRKSLVLSDFESNFRHIIDKKSQVFLGLHPSIPTVALINASRTMERYVELSFVKQVIERLKELGVCVVRIYYGNFISVAPGTAFLTVMKVHDMKIIDYLDAPCGATGWRHFTQFLPEISAQNEIPGLLTHYGKQHIKLKGPKLGEFQSSILVKAVQFACDALISCERQLNIIDEEKSDGNVGTRLKNMAEGVNKRINSKKLPISCPYGFLKKMGIIAESAIGGAMGSIYGVMFESAANLFGGLPDTETVTPGMWAKAFTVGVESLKRYCMREPDEKTMLYPLKRSDVTIRNEMEKGEHYLQYFGLGVSAAEEAAQETKLPQSKYSDAGAHAVGIWMRAVLEGVKLMTGGNLCEGESLNK
ncbi:triokinase/FMN cyclase [Tribolium castaneum]|uniref:Triokinase/FMN cyclase n=1 Tax=Tribolium castaneum TaxID=7070 RepID=D6WX22_TRICA|nr:PREDICTED: triokinase/FMN cyclase [Tribolium castaneum]EFA08779.1 Bifunctional ATP-dependent dihydroxyacetone kinase/FAD-AMP lyase (cyclizing)-like Protein [Tribolium castaneum]|eukprot:XP_970200.1 PREDICTED: triokinase/FMN cyclase [Tribolium castaneum]